MTEPWHDPKEMAAAIQSVREGAAAVRTGLVTLNRAVTALAAALAPPVAVTETVEADDPADAFEFARALHDPDVRAEISRRGYISGTLLYVGQTPVDPDDLRPSFRVWREPSVPGGWTGTPILKDGQGALDAVDYVKAYLRERVAVGDGRATVSVAEMAEALAIRSRPWHSNLMHAAATDGTDLEVTVAAAAEPGVYLVTPSGDEKSPEEGGTA